MNFNIKHKFIPAAAIIALGICIFLTVFKGPHPYTWERGDTLSYSITSNDVFAADIPGAQSMRKRLSLKGVLNMRILDVNDDTVRAAVRIDPVSVTVEGQRSSAAEKLYSTIFIVDMSREGEFLNFRFSNEIASDDERNIINTMRAFQCIVRDGFFTGWSEKETDANGIASVSYQADDRSLIRKKESYTSILSPDGRTDTDTVIDIKRSEYKAFYEEKGSWLKTLDGGELLAYSSGGKVYLRTSSYVHLERISGDSIPAVDLFDKDFDFDAMVTRWSSSPKNKNSIAVMIEKENLRKKTGGMSPDQYFTDLFKKNKKFTSSAIREIMEYIRLYPEYSGMIPEYLLSHEINAQQRAVLTHALGRVGHAEAQEALVSIINGRDFKKDNKIQAVIAFSDISIPEKKSITALWELSAHEDADIAGTAVLSLGSIAATLGKSSDDDEKDQSAEIKHRLENGLETVQNSKKRIAMIHAAGNTGDEDFIEPISTFLGDQSPNVRSTAASSLAHFKDEKVDSILCVKLKSEENINVRGSLVAALEQRKPVDESVNTVLEQIRSEDNEIVRGRMYRYLVKNREYAGVREKLAELKNTESSIEFRKMIIRALNSKLSSR